MNIRSKVKIIGLGLGLGDRVAGVSYAPLSSAPLVIVKSVKVVSGNCVTVLIMQVGSWAPLCAKRRRFYKVLPLAHQSALSLRSHSTGGANSPPCSSLFFCLSLTVCVRKGLSPVHTERVDARQIICIHPMSNVSLRYTEAIELPITINGQNVRVAIGLHHQTTSVLNDVIDNDVIDSWMNMHTLLASRPNVVTF